MKKIELWTIALQMNRIWNQILENRLKMKKLMDNETPYISEKLIALDTQNIQLGNRVAALKKRYFVCSGT